MREIESMPIYLIDWSNRSKENDRRALKVAKEIQEQKKCIVVYVDERTNKLISIDKIKKHKLQIIRVKLPFKGLVYIERQTAIKKGYINE